MSSLATSSREFYQNVSHAWNRFWFTPAPVHTLCLLRVLAGGMLFYTHLVWSLGLTDFFGDRAWLSTEASRQFHEGTLAWTIFWHIDSPGLLWMFHLCALAVFLLFFLGLFTRVTSVLAWILTLMYCHRQTGALFGLDQINAMLVMYLMLAPSGALYSLDRWIARRQSGGSAPEPQPSIAANVAIRLIQIHLCVIYLFSGIGKLRGDQWADGSAVWFALANLEYQSVDMTWMAHFPIFIALLTHLTVAWEIFYCFTIWPRTSRWLTLAMSVAVHGGIALFMGMITFGLAMIIANIAFIPPEMTRTALNRCRNFAMSIGRGKSASPQS